jgi:hypothetical protein
MAWLMREVVIASPAGDNGWPIFGGFSGHWFRLFCLWTMGLSLGLGEIPMQLQTTVIPAGAVTFLKASSRPSSSCPLLCDGGNPRSSLLVQVTTVPRCRFLLGGAIRVARRVPSRQLDSWLAATLSVGA